MMSDLPNIADYVDFSEENAQASMIKSVAELIEAGQEIRELLRFGKDQYGIREAYIRPGHEVRMVSAAAKWDEILNRIKLQK